MTIVAATDGVNLGSSKELQFYSRAVTGGTIYVSIARNANTVVALGHSFVSTAQQLPVAKYTNVVTGTGTASAGDLSGASNVFADYSGQAAITITTRTATLMFGDIPGAVAGGTYRLVVTNRNSGTLTLTGGTGVTISGTATLATNTTREFVVTLTSTTAITLQSVAVGSIS